MFGLSFLWYWTKRIYWAILFFICNTILSICYSCKGKEIPIITNPLLFRSATKLAQEIREGKLRSETVVRAYIDRINEVNPYLNAVVKDRFDEALNEAKAVDELVQSGKLQTEVLKREFPFLGVPLTVKCLLTVKGFPNTGGSKVYADEIATEDAIGVTLMKKAGAIVLATTNAPEFGISFETNNLVHGMTRNPYDTNRTPGGSSGGEAALLGAGASIIGLGNDLAGSIRVPAHFTGTYAHKASMGFIPSSGVYINFPDDLSDYIYTGPMCRYPDDLLTMTKVLTEGHENRPKLDREVNFKKLKVFYCLSCGDPMSKPVDKDITNAIKMAASHFSKTYGVFAREVKIPPLCRSNYILIYYFLKALPNPTKALTSGKVENFSFLFELTKFLIGKSTFSFAIIILLTFLKLPIVFRKRRIPRYERLLQKLYLEFDSLLDEDSVFIYPTFPQTAPYHYGSLPLTLSTCYTSVFNFLGLPATNCPAGFNRNGLPQGIQIIGKMNNDVLTLACAAELGKVFGGWVPPGCRGS